MQTMIPVQLSPILRLIISRSNSYICNFVLAVMTYNNDMSRSIIYQWIYDFLQMVSHYSKNGC